MKAEAPFDQPTWGGVMKRLLFCLLLASFTGASFATPVRGSMETGYVPKPEFTMSDEIPAWKEGVWRGITWRNESHAPCYIILYLGTPIFWVACDGMDSVQLNLQEFAFGKPITLRYVPKK